MFDPHLVMRSLAVRRPIFHSEADFQHEFAWEVRSHLPNCEVRLEVPSPGEGIGTTDIVVYNGGAVHGVELKYLTRRHQCEFKGEKFYLKAHGAQDLRRHDVLKDVWRLERFNGLHAGPSHVIALTNDRSYWQPFQRRATIDAAFRLDEGRTVSGELLWAEGAGAGTIRGRAVPLALGGHYQMAWQDYSSLSEGSCLFRYLAVEVGQAE